jgi:hypothetical protein
MYEHSAVRALVKPITPALLAAYTGAEAIKLPLIAMIEETLIM